ncbi:MAG: dipicolinate synthase subunit B [Clostridia bacterium]|nr:dipicolinate synthase subunit B [Clostridia bacterium]
MNGKRIGFCITGSFCTFSHILPVMEQLAAQNEVTPILSPASLTMDTRFFAADAFRREVERICARPAMTTIVEAEQIGPRKLFDIMLIAPCTGNTLAKLNYGITDTAVVMAAKAHVRNDRPLVLAVSTNDALGTAAQNIGALLNRRLVYFVPFRQDDSVKKPRSMVARFELSEATLEAALRGEQLQPVIV